MISTKRFWLILCLWMSFLVSMAYNFELTEPKTKANDKPKYPYVERVEVGYKIKPFESSDTIQYYAKKVEDKEEAEYEAKKQRIKESAAYAAAITFFFYVVSGAAVGIILLIIGLILLLLARWQRNIAKKR